MSFRNYDIACIKIAFNAVTDEKFTHYLSLEKLLAESTLFEA
jgi:hypothetical protein